MKTITDRLNSVTTLLVEPDLSSLKPNERDALLECILAADSMTEIYLQQVSPDNYSLYANLAACADSPEYRYFMIQGSPWDSFDHDEAFIDAIGQRPKGANLYPTDMTPEEWRAHLEAHPEDKDAFMKPTTVIFRGIREQLMAVPYSMKYAPRLSHARIHLECAAALLDDCPLKDYLRARAEAFLTNEYEKSDLLWVKLDGKPFDVTIGPYEEYHDELFGLKATFQAFISIPDAQSTENMDKFIPLIASFDTRLAEQYQCSTNGAVTPLQVVRDVYRGGEAAFRRQFVAHNLPNDATFRKTHGYRQVFSATMMEAKFNQIAIPTGNRIMAQEDWADITFADRLLAVTGHEIAHGIGPKFVVRDDIETDEDYMNTLGEIALPIEEAKADTLGMRLLSFYCDYDVITRDELRRAMISCIPTFFMGFRKGFSEAHARGNLIEYNWLTAHYALLYDTRTGCFSIDVDYAISCFHNLSDAFIQLQIGGNYEAAKAFIQKWTTVPPEIREIVAHLRDLPLEITSKYHINTSSFMH